MNYFFIIILIINSISAKEIYNKHFLSNEQLKSRGISIPKCPKGDGFKPLGSYYPASGIFFTPVNSSAKAFKKRNNNQLVIHTGQDLLIARYVKFIKEFARGIKFHEAEVPINLITNNQQSLYLNGLNGLSPFPNIIETEQYLTEWTQDVFQLGITKLNGKLKKTLLALPNFSYLDFQSNLDEEEKHLSDCCSFDILNKRNMPTNYGANSGGNIEVAPGDVVITSESISKELKDFFKDNNNEVITFDTSFLYVGHIDEIFNIVKLPNSYEACDYAVIVADTKVAKNIIGSSTLKEYVKAINPFSITKPITDDNYDEFIEANKKIQDVLDNNLDLLLKKLSEKTQCDEDEVKVIKFPVLFWKHRDFDREDRVFQSIWPNPVNSIVLNDLIVVPKTKFHALQRQDIDEYIKDELKKINFSVLQLSDPFYFSGGNFHCASNVIRACFP